MVCKYANNSYPVLTASHKRFASSWVDFLRYSDMVVAPITCILDLDNAGFNIKNKIVGLVDSDNSWMMPWIRSSNSPQYFVPATRFNTFKDIIR